MQSRDVVIQNKGGIMLQKIMKSKFFFMAGMIGLALTTDSNGSVGTVAGNSVTRITFNPSTPNILLNNQKVNISFSYATTQPGGVHIFARPISGGSPTVNYAASGAPLSPTGTGTGTQYFTIITGNVTVDQVRFQMFTADQKQMLFEAFVPVHFEYLAP